MAALLDTRHRHIARVVAQQFSMTVAAVEEVLADERHLTEAANFFAAEGTPSKLIFFRQSRDEFTEDGELVEAAGSPHPRQSMRRERQSVPARARAIPGTMWPCRWTDPLSHAGRHTTRFPAPHPPDAAAAAEPAHRCHGPTSRPSSPLPQKLRWRSSL